MKSWLNIGWDTLVILDCSILFIRDVDDQRKIYQEKAMPELRMQTFTPIEHEQEIITKTEEIETLKEA